MNIWAWLNRLGLTQYEQAFRENDVDADVLLELTADDLKQLGVTSIGHRRKLLAAISALRNVPAIETAGPLAASPEGLDVGFSGAERRQLTVMFCDLVGSTALSAQFDPEDLRDIITVYQRTVAGVIANCGGYLARYMGDGVLAYFGYPRAHEDDAERAVLAGLAATEAVRCIEPKSVKLQARVGIATGLVIVGDLLGEGLAEEQAVVGETPNLAARLQALAEPDTVVIAPGTRRLLGALFEYRELGPVELKGIPGRVAASQVLRPNTIASRFEALRGTGLTRLVGREEEIELLLRRWVRTKAGDGQIVLVSGEPGIGKSRVAAALNERLEAERFIRLRYFCSPYHEDTALFPIMDQLGRAAGFAREDPPTVKLQKLEDLLTHVAAPAEDLVFIADLLSLPASERHPFSDLTPQRKKERTLEALLRQIERLTREQPVLLIFEDVHWIDPTSRELLDLIIERARSLPLLVVLTFRPEFRCPWMGQPRVSMLVLNRLDFENRAALALQIARGKPLPDDVIGQIVDRSDGVPLFIEELTKSVLESGLLREETDRYVLEGALPPFAIPTSLHDSLMARLDRLPSVRHIAQIGAAIGREFSYGLLRAACDLPEEELQTGLGRLIASELVFQRGIPPEAVYAFKHALVQDAAHGSLLREPRRLLHARIAAALETYSPELMENQPELFAQHFAEAGLAEKSAEYWGKAGRRSIARSAMAEAAAQFKKGLDQLALLPETPERQRRELEFYSALGAALRYVKGQATPEMGHAFSRARELWEQLGSPSEFLYASYGQSRYHMYRGEFDLAQQLDENLLRLSRERNDTPGLLLGHQSFGRDLILFGRFAEARQHLEEVLALYDPRAHGSLVHQTGSDPRVAAQGHLGIALFCLGFPEQALQRSNAAIAEASALAHPPSVAASLAQGTRLLSLIGNDLVFQKRAGELNAIATEQGFPLYEALGTIYSGWSKVKAGDVAEGISLLRNGSSAYRGTGAESRMPYYTALLAEACELAGRLEETLVLLENALQFAEETGERWFTAELYRRQGELLLRQLKPAAADELYRRALEVAREQEAKLWELRAAVSLARLCRDRNHQQEARDILAPTYAWFTEGFDTPDLKRAKLLIDELSLS